GEFAVSDNLAVTAPFTLSHIGPNLNGVLLKNGQAWAALGFAVGQQVFVPGYGVRTIIGYENGVGTNDDGLPLDGAVLLVDNGNALGDLPTAQLTGTTVSLTSRYRVAGKLTLAGTA